MDDSASILQLQRPILMPIISFLISNKDSLISKERGIQVHRKYTGMNKSRTEITKVKKIQKRKRLVSPQRTSQIRFGEKEA